MQRLRELTTRHGMLLIVDEVQSGMGRTGRMFAIEHTGVEPDIVTMAKGIASGLPLGVATARAEVMSWPPGTHASTFGGNPVACAAALATIKLLRDGLMRNAADVGAHLMAGAKALMDKHPLIGDVRGRGLMIGIELVRDRQTKERATTEARRARARVLQARPARARRRPQRDPPVAAAGADERSRPTPRSRSSTRRWRDRGTRDPRACRSALCVVSWPDRAVDRRPSDARQSLGKMGEDLACARAAAPRVRNSCSPLPHALWRN